MRLSLFIVLTALLILISGESQSAVDSTTLNSSSISGTVVLSKTTKYIMKGFNYVENGGKIVIPEGTVILGDFETKGTLIIKRGGKIYAAGTADAPIIFTSEKPAGQRAAGDWGGIIILGRSGINTASGVDSAEIEGFGPGLGPIYGGQPRIDDDSSGVLKYARLEFPGINLTGISGNEINGLTMGGVGSRTVIENVQVSYSGDDSFEWFGGTVNCKYLIAYKGLDDDWDCDNGFRGRVQFCLSVKDKDFADVSSSNGFEIDNNSDNPTNTNGPRTRPFFSNMTVVGPFETTSTPVNPQFQRGGHLRRNMQACIYNSLIMGWRTGIRFDGANVCNDANSGVVQLRTNIFSGNVTLADQTGGSVFPDPISFINNFNTVFAANSSVQLTSPFNIYPDPSGSTINNWMPAGGSPALGGSDFSNPNLTGFILVSYRGAFGSQNWTERWAQFNPKNYLVPVTSNYFITIIPEGFYNLGTGRLNSSDSLRAYLRASSSPYGIIDSAIAVIDNVTFTGKFVFKYANSGTYYIQVKHRNHIETWSKNGGTPFTQGADNFYDFTFSNTQAFGNNEVLKGSKFCIFGGDADQTGIIESNDLSIIDNDAFNFATGYIISDISGDGFVDAEDLSVTDNNVFDFVTKITPLP